MEKSTTPKTVTQTKRKLEQSWASKIKYQYRNLPYSLVIITPLAAKSAGSHPSVSIRQCCQLKIKEELWSYVIYIAKWPASSKHHGNLSHIICILALNYCTVKCEMCITRKLQCRAIKSRPICLRISLVQPCL